MERGINRGDVITIALQGDFGKPRPALVIQSDLFSKHPTVTVLPFTTDLIDAALYRIPVEPAAGNGVRERSHIMVDKAATTRREKIGQICGRLDDRTMLEVNRALALFLGFA